MIQDTCKIIHKYVIVDNIGEKIKKKKPDIKVSAFYETELISNKTYDTNHSSVFLRDIFSAKLIPYFGFKSSHFKISHSPNFVSSNHFFQTLSIEKKKKD